MIKKKIPLRKCVVTNEQHPKGEMFRIVKNNEGQVCVDLTGKVRGRGAYVTKSKSVIMTAMKKKTLDRQLEIEIPQTIYDDLLKLLGDNID